MTAPRERWAEVKPWSVVARNLPEHASNPIHTDAGARAQGFERALVAGVTSYLFAVHPLVEAWGLDWIARGSAGVRFRSPVFHEDQLQIVPEPQADESVRVELFSARSPLPLVTVEGFAPEPTGAASAKDATDGGGFLRREGERLQTIDVILKGEFGSDYANRAGDDIVERISSEGVVHPAVWPAIANRVFHAQVARGSWIHTRSFVRHHSLAFAGETVTVDSTVVQRFVRSGERAIADVVIRVGERVVATLEHEAIIDLSVA